jgi:hypothetical protein
MPFAAIGFAAVVSMMPGVYLFRTWSGLVQIAGGGDTTLSLLQGTIAAGVTASIIILAMSLGLIIPKMVVDYFGDRPTQTEIAGVAQRDPSRDDFLNQGVGTATTSVLRPTLAQ